MKILIQNQLSNVAGMIIYKKNIFGGLTTAPLRLRLCLQFAGAAS